MTSEYHKPSRTELRKFGLVLMVGFGLIGLFPLIRHHPLNRWALIISLVSAAVALIAPSALAQVHRVWMIIGTALGWVNSRIILGAVFYLMITPARMLMKMAGHDPMRRGFDKKSETYRVNRKPRPPSHMHHQY